MTSLLEPHITAAVPEQGTKTGIGTKLVESAAAKIPEVVPKRRRLAASKSKFQFTVKEKELKHLRKLGYEPPEKK